MEHVGDPDDHTYIVLNGKGETVIQATIEKLRQIYAADADAVSDEVDTEGIHF